MTQQHPEQTPEDALRDAQEGFKDISDVLRAALAADDELAAQADRRAEDR